MLRVAIDCLVLVTPGHDAWVHSWVHGHGGQNGRVRLHSRSLAELAPARCVLAAADSAAVPDPNLLGRASLALQRYDACLLPVAPASLSWVRTALAHARTRLRTPLLAVVHDLKAPAIQDLLALGLADFLRAPICSEELRARLDRLQANLQRRHCMAAAGGRTGLNPRVAEPLTAQGWQALHEPLATYALHNAARPRVSRALAAYAGRHSVSAGCPYR